MFFWFCLFFFPFDSLCIFPLPLSVDFQIFLLGISPQMSQSKKIIFLLAFLSKERYHWYHWPIIKYYFFLSQSNINIYLKLHTADLAENDKISSAPRQKLNNLQASDSEIQSLLWLPFQLGFLPSKMQYFHLQEFCCWMLGIIFHLNPTESLNKGNPCWGFLRLFVSPWVQSAQYAPRVQFGAHSLHIAGIVGFPQ